MRKEHFYRRRVQNKYRNHENRNMQSKNDLKALKCKYLIYFSI